MRNRRTLLVPAVLLLGPGLAGCSTSLAADDVATAAEDALQAQIGARPDIVCPDDLAAEQGAEVRCTLTAGNDPAEYGVTVTVTAVDGADAQFDVEVDEEPLG